MTEHNIVTTTRNGDKIEADSEFDAREDFPRAGTLTGEIDDRFYTIDGTYKSKIYWAPPDFRGHPMWHASATIGNAFDEEYGIIWLNRDNWAMLNDLVLYHERGHNLTHRHDDGGIMAVGGVPDDVSQPELHDVTKDVAKHTDQLHLLDYSDITLSDLREFVKRWRNDEMNITLADLRWLVNRWASNETGQTMYADNMNDIITGHEEWGQTLTTGGFYRAENSDDDNSWHR